MLATCLHMMKGTPYIYQGEEIGMTNVRFNTVEEYEDIETKGAYDTYVNIIGIPKEEMMKAIHARSRDNARTPMQWDDGIQGGFTTGTPWFTVNPNYKVINAKSQMSDENSIFHYYKRLIALRHEKKIIVYGDFKLWMEDSEEVFAYIRTLGDEKLLVLNNFTAHDVSFKLPEDFDGKADIWIGNYQGEMPGRLRPYEARVYHLEG